jgi:hypothetical protein
MLETLKNISTQLSHARTTYSDLELTYDKLKKIQIEIFDEKFNAIKEMTRRNNGYVFMYLPYYDDGDNEFNFCYLSTTHINSWFKHYLKIETIKTDIVVVAIYNLAIGLSIEDAVESAYSMVMI